MSTPVPETVPDSAPEIVSTPVPETVPTPVPETVPTPVPETVAAPVSVPVTATEPNIMDTQSILGENIVAIKFLKSKKNGFFVDLGVNDPIVFNNTVVLENNFSWNGLSFINGNDGDSVPSIYSDHRHNSKFVIGNLDIMNFIPVFANNNVPKNVDYLSFNLNVSNETAMKALPQFSSILNIYKFATISLKHDIFVGDLFNTRESYRKLLTDAGYKLVFPDVSREELPQEDWFVFPALVDMNYVNGIAQTESMDYNAIIEMMP